MEPIKTTTPKKRRIVAKIANVLSYILVSVVLLVFLIAILIQLPAVQNFAKGKIQTFLQHKLKTKVEIGKLRLSIPNSISLQNIYIEDQTKDTLLYGGELKVDIDMLKLLNNEVQIKEINVKDITAKVKRVLPDTIFNFQFIVDAFMGEQTKTPETQDTAAMKMNIENIIIDNTRIVYKDVITGNDMDLKITHFDSPIKTFDINHLYFDIPKFTLNGLKGYFYQNEPLQAKIVKAVSEATQEPENFLQLKNDEIALKNIDFDFKSAPSDISMGLKVNRLVAHPESLDMKNGKYSFKDLTLDRSDIAMVMSNKKAPPVTAEQKKDQEAIPPFTISAKDFKITGSNFKMDNTSMPVLKEGMDYGHMDIKDLNFSANNLFFNGDTASVAIKSASFKEKSGFVLNDFNTNFLFTPTATSLTDLYIKTPGTTIRRNVIINYPSLELLSTNPELADIDLDFESTTISVKDILTLAPMLKAQPALANASQNFMINGRIKGRVDNLHFYDFRFKGFSQTTLFLSGTITGLPDPRKFASNLDIKYFTTGRKDILSLVPPNTLPANITIPESISAAGHISGNMNNLTANIGIGTNLGSAKINGTIQNFSNPKAAKYDMAISANSIQLGVIMQDPVNLGPLSANFKVMGSGIDIASANAKINGVVTSAVFKKYNYKNFRLDASIANQQFQANASIHDPNIDVTLEAGGKMNGKFPSLHINTTIDSLKTLPLNLTPQPTLYTGKIKADFTNTDPDNLAGTLFLTHSVLVNNGQRMQMDSLELNADNTGGKHSLTVKSDFLNLTINGQYKLTQIADVFQQAIDPYFAMSATKNVAKVDPYNFSITGGIVENEALRAFMPGIKKLKPINLTAHFATDSGWNAFISVPYVSYDTYIINDLKLSASTKNGALTFNTSLDHFKSGTSLDLFVTTLEGSLQNNNLDFTLNTKDSKSVNKYIVSGLLSQPSLNNYIFSLKPENLLLNYNKWSVNAGNSIQYQNNDITATNFVLSQGNQQLSINSIGSGTNKPLSIDFRNFSIATLTAFVQNDSLLVNGTLNGNATVKNIQVQPVFTTDLTVNDLSIYKDTLGTLTAKVNNNVADTYNADIRLTGKGNEVTVLGNYFLKPQNSSYDFTLNVVSLQMKSLEGFTKGGIREARGNLYGNVAVNGTLDKPNIDGKLNFNNTAFVASALGNLFKVDNEAIAVIKNEGILFNTFTIRDTANNAIVIDGAVNTADFLNYTFDLKINADNFQAINSTRKDNRLFYGKMVFSTALTITGTPTQPVVSGSLTINNKTDFTVVLPQSEPGVVQREGIVRFVNYSDSLQDSLFMAPYDSLKTSPLIGYDISVNINIDKDAIFNLIVDEGNGDFLRLKGIAQLTAGIDASGKITLVGSYEIAEGSYALSFNFIKRNFIIQKGSTIVWTGEPTTAQINVTAIYIANTAPLDLVSGQVTENTVLYRQKLPFEVHLNIKGELMQPEISFDVVLPTEGNYNVATDIVSTVQTALTQLRQETGELNKQVFALLLLNRFVGQNPFDNSSGGGANAGSFAKESVSKLLTEQLNQLATGLIEGVDINFDVASTQDYSASTDANQGPQQRTDFNVGLSKRLLNDRLTVTLGTAFELEGPRPTNRQQNNASPNIAVDYKLSKDGRYMLRAYRRNDYTGAIEGYVIESGVSFIISVDYNRFNQIFLSKANRAKKREIKKENKQSDKQVKTDTSQTILLLKENKENAKQLKTGTSQTILPLKENKQSDTQGPIEAMEAILPSKENDYEG